MNDPLYDYIAGFPYLVVTLGIILMLTLDFCLKRRAVQQFTVLSVCVCLSAWAVSLPYLGTLGFSERAFHGLMFIDPFGFVFHSIILFGAAATLFLNVGYLDAQRVRNSIDIDVLVLLSAVGGMVMVSAANLIVIFLAFELLSIAVYALAGVARQERASSEAALKYFLLGAFSSAFLLYGMTLIYGVTGTMDLLEIGRSVSRIGVSNPIFLTGMGLIIFGFAFKVSLVPFHFWAPDVYQGTPVSLVTFMAVVVKAAAFGCFMRIMMMAFGSTPDSWVGIMSLLCGATMLIGNFCALRQRSMKRLLAYSSIAHAGYALIGFVVGDAGGWEAAIFYLMVYSLMTIGSFGVVLVATAGTKNQYANDDIETFRGLGWRHPLLGLTMTIAVLSLAGLPPLAGFFGKFYLFTAALRGGFVGLAVFAALNSVLSLYYYLRILVVMYFSETPDEVARMRPTLSARFALTVATLGTIVVGVFSSEFIELSRFAASGIKQERANRVASLNNLPYRSQR